MSSSKTPGDAVSRRRIIPNHLYVVKVFRTEGILI